MSETTSIRTLSTALTIWLLMAPPAALAQSQPYYLGLSQTLSHESNLYRIGDQQQLSGGNSKSDLVSSTALFGGVDQRIGRQRVYGGASVRANRYQSNSSLNNESYNLDLATDWETVNHLSGTLSVGSSQSLSRFNELNNDTVETQRNIERIQQIENKLRYGLNTKLGAEFTLGARHRSFSAASYAQSESRQQHLSMGVSYLPSDLLRLGVSARRTTVDFPNFLSTAVDGSTSMRLNRSDLDLTAWWQATGKSTFNLRISPTRSVYDRAVAADFSGLTGSGTWKWTPGSKLKLSSMFSRDTGISLDAIGQGIATPGTVDFSRITTALKTQADYALTGKVSLTGSLTLSQRDLDRTFSQGSSSLSAAGPSSSPIAGNVLKVNQQSEGVVLAGTPLVELGDPAAWRWWWMC